MHEREQEYADGYASGIYESEKRHGTCNMSEVGGGVLQTDQSVIINVMSNILNTLQTYINFEFRHISPYFI